MKTLEEIVRAQLIAEGPKDYPSVGAYSPESYARDRLDAMSKSDFLSYISDAYHFAQLELLAHIAERYTK